MHNTSRGDSGQRSTLIHEFNASINWKFNADRFSWCLREHGGRRLLTSPRPCKMHAAALPELDQHGWAHVASESESCDVCHEMTYLRRSVIEMFMGALGKTSGAAKASAQHGLHLRWRWRFQAVTRQPHMFANFLHNLHPDTLQERIFFWNRNRRASPIPSGAIELMVTPHGRINHEMFTVRCGKVQLVRTSGKPCANFPSEKKPLETRRDRNASALFTLVDGRCNKFGRNKPAILHDVAAPTHLPSDLPGFARCGFVQREAERKLVLPHHT